MKLRSFCLPLTLFLLVSITFSTHADYAPFAADLVVINANVHTNGIPSDEALVVAPTVLLNLWLESASGFEELMVRF